MGKGTRGCSLIPPSPKARDRWHPPAGAVFNESAVLSFYAIGDINPTLKRLFASVNCKCNIALNDDTHTADVTQRLEKRP
jgi:hypothetical protein